MRRLFLFIICFAAFSTAYPQIAKEKEDSLALKLKERADNASLILKEKLDSFINIRESRQKYDTSYIQRPKQDWSLRMRLNVSGWWLDWLSEPEDADFSLSTKPKTTVSIGASYRGLSVGFSANLTKLFKKNKDAEYSIASYGNRFGFEGFYHYSKNFNAIVRIGDREADISSIIDRINMLNLSGYYALNGKKFSFPAAFSQSYIQKRSAGSWMLGFNAFFSDSRLNPPGESGNQQRLHLLTFGLGGGYGYNWVIKKKWLLHASALPSFVVVHNNFIDIDGERTRMEYIFPEITANTRISIVRSFGNMFAGISSVANINVLGKRSDMRITNTKWKARAFVGIRL